MKLKIAVPALALTSLLAGCFITVPGTTNKIVVDGQQLVTPNGVSNPVITSLTANPTSLRVGQVLTVQIESVSPSGKTLQYVWSATGGTLSATSGKLITWQAPSAPGAYSILVSVTDGVGGQAAASLNITVTENGEVAVSPPVLPTPAPSSGTSAPAKDATWTQVFGVGGIKDFHFINANIGWVIQQGDFDNDGNAEAGKVETTTRIRHTTDGGRTWQTQFEITKPNFSQLPLGTIYFVDSQNGWAGGHNGTLLRTTDGGKKWVLTDWSGAGRDWIYGIRFKDLAEGLMAGGRSLLRSTDGGVTWNQVAELPNGGSVVEYYPNGKAFIQGYDGNFDQVYLYEDGKLTKISGLEQVKLTSISFPDPTNTLKAWATTNGGLYRSEDGGATFTKVEKLNLGTEFTTSFVTTCLAFTSPTEGLLLEEDGSFTTQDGGQTWQREKGRIASNAYLRPKKLQLFDRNNGFCGLEYHDGLNQLYRLSQ